MNTQKHVDGTSRIVEESAKAEFEAKPEKSGRSVVGTIAAIAVAVTGALAYRAEVSQPRLNQEIANESSDLHEEMRILNAQIERLEAMKREGKKYNPLDRKRVDKIGSALAELSAPLIPGMSPGAHRIPRPRSGDVGQFTDDKYLSEFGGEYELYNIGGGVSVDNEKRLVFIGKPSSKLGDNYRGSLIRYGEKDDKGQRTYKTTTIFAESHWGYTLYQYLPLKSTTIIDPGAVRELDQIMTRLEKLGIL